MSGDKSHFIKSIYENELNLTHNMVLEVIFLYSSQ